MFSKAVCVLAFLGLAVAIPQHGQTTLMARYVLHNTDWVSMATISTSKGIEGYPFVGLKSISDGVSEDSTGIPYVYMTDMDVSGIDLNVDNRVSILASLTQGDYCAEQNWDPQDPRCARIFVTGRFVKVEDEQEKEYGRNALISRHPSMESWPINHGFYVGKVQIEQIIVIDWFGGVKYADMDQYYKITADELNKYNLRV